MLGGFRNDSLINPLLAQMASTIFTLSEPLTQVIVDLLVRKSLQRLTDKENKQIYDQMKENSVFPLVTNPKTLIEVCSGMSLCPFRAGRTLRGDGQCQILLEGMVKIYEIVPIENQEGDDSQFPNGDILENDIRISVINISQRKELKIERSKVPIGEIIDYGKPSKNKLVFEALSAGKILKIRKDVYEPIVVSAYLAKVKRLQQFFGEITLLQKMYRSSLQDFINSLEQVSCNFGKKIFSQGEQVSHIYIVKSGEFILEKSICSETQMKRGKIIIKKTSQEERKSQIRTTHQHFRACPYKIIHGKEILGASESVFNNNVYMSTMRCHQEGSVLFKVEAEAFFKKLIVPENTRERVVEILGKKHDEKLVEIARGVKFN